jgi:hypothetical protein
MTSHLQIATFLLKKASDFYGSKETGVQLRRMVYCMLLRVHCLLLPFFCPSSMKRTRGISYFHFLQYLRVAVATGNLR